MLIQEEGLVGNHSPDFVLFLLTSDDEDFVLGLNGSELFGQKLSVSETNALGGLRSKFVNLHLLVVFVIVVQTGSVSLQNVVGLEADDIVEEASKLVNFTAHLNSGSSILLDKLRVSPELTCKLLGARLQLVKSLSLLKHVQILLLTAELSLFFDTVLNLLLESIERLQSFRCEVLGRRLVLLHTFQMLDDILSLHLLFIDDHFELLILLVDLLEHFLFKTFLLLQLVLHVLAGSERVRALAENLLELRDLLTCCLLEGHTLTAASMVLEVAVIAQSHVVSLAKDTKFVQMLAVLNDSALLLWLV